MSEELCNALYETMGEDTSNILADMLEIGIDSILEEGLLKEIPIVSTVRSLYKMQGNVRDRVHLKKLLTFCDELNRGALAENKCQKYRKKISENKKYREKELEYIVVLTDRYLDYQKPRFLARLYLAFLDAIISWEMFCEYSEMIDRVLPSDYKKLCLEDNCFAVTEDGDDSIQRLQGLGLVKDITNRSPFVVHGNGNYALTIDSLNQSINKESLYEKTKTGKLLSEILMGRFLTLEIEGE